MVLAIPSPTLLFILVLFCRSLCCAPEKRCLCYLPQAGKCSQGVPSWLCWLCFFRGLRQHSRVAFMCGIQEAYRRSLMFFSFPQQQMCSKWQTLGNSLFFLPITSACFQNKLLRNKYSQWRFEGFKRG